MIQKALVTYANKEVAKLLIKRECACSGKDTCKKSCFTLAEETIDIQLSNEIGTQKGDIVEIEGNASMILLYSLCVFILPIVFAILIFILLSSLTTHSLILYGISGLCFFVSFLLFAIGINKIAKKKNKFKIIRIISHGI